jgi:predicted hydrocarbon binding protein
MIEAAPPNYFPNRLGRLMLLAFEEIIGRSGLNAMLNLSSLSHLIVNCPPDDEKKAVSFETISQLQHALEQEYGPHGGHGLAVRAGRVFFSSGLRTYGPKLGLNETDFRLQPPGLKLLDVLDAITEFFNQNTDQQVILEQSEQSFLWRIERCPWCWEREEYEPVCHFVVGMLQEALYWVSGGKYYNVVEETCIAQGEPACLIVIDRAPLA